MPRKSLIILAVLFLVLFLSVAAMFYKRANTFADHQQITITLGGHQMRVEVVNTPASMSKGLGERQNIGSDGMLFIFAEPIKNAFWMKDMRFDIDIIWLANKRIVDITEKVPAPKTALANEDRNLPVYEPTQTVDMVLEVPTGTAQQLSLHKGDFFQSKTWYH